MRYECDFCGLSGSDLPDDVDPEFIFEPGDSGETACQACSITATASYWLTLPVDDEEVEE